MAVPVPANKARSLGVDACRVLGVMGVIWLHLSMALRRDYVSGGCCVPFFIAVAVLFSLRPFLARPDTAVAPALRARARRILVPFAAWSVLFGAVRVLKGALLPGHQGAALHISWLELLLEGTAGPYWFLPFIYFASVVAVLVGHVLARHPTRASAVATGFFVLAIVLTLFDHGTVVRGLDSAWQAVALDTPDVSVLTHWWVQLPMLCASLSFGIVWHRHGARVARPSWLAFCVCTLAVLLIEIELAGTIRAPRLDHLAGFLLLGAALTLPAGELVEKLAGVGRRSYTVYLSHVVWMWPFITFGQRLAHVGLGYMVGSTLGVTVLGVLTSLILGEFPALSIFDP